MAHTYGPLSLPVDVGVDGDAIGDPVLDVFAEAFPVVLTAWAGTAWAELAPNEPLVRRVFKHDPHPDDFLEKNLPALFLYRDEEPVTEYTDVLTIMVSTVYALWVAPPATQTKRAARQAFLNAISKCFSEMVALERDPSWVRDGDTSAPGLAYGSNISLLAGLDSWALKDVRRAILDIPIEGHSPAKYAGFLASILVRESDDVDQAAQGFVPTEMEIRLSGVVPPLDLVFKDPDPDPP